MLFHYSMHHCSVERIKYSENIAISSVLQKRQSCLERAEAFVAFNIVIVSVDKGWYWV